MKLDPCTSNRDPNSCTIVFHCEFLKILVATAIELTVDVSKTLQQIIGFGGAFTDAASFNFFNLSQNTRLNLAQAYFGNEGRKTAFPFLLLTLGIGYTMGRVPLGSCDFSLRYFNYDNVEGDFNLTNFALAPEDFNYKVRAIFG